MENIPKVHIELVKEKTVNCEEQFLSSPALRAEFGRTLYFKENENEIRSPTREIVTVCCVDKNGRVLAVECAFVGTSSSAPVGMKELFMSAILCNADGIICFHNHPSGDAHPSIADNLMTQRIEKAGAILDIKLYDHIIVAENGYYSYEEKKINEWRNRADEEVG